jgi:hypothetical protein
MITLIKKTIIGYNYKQSPLSRKELDRYSDLVKLYVNNIVSNRNYKQIQDKLKTSKPETIRDILNIYLIDTLCIIICQYNNEHLFKEYYSFQGTLIDFHIENVRSTIIDGNHIIIYNSTSNIMKIFNFYTQMQVYEIKFDINHDIHINTMFINKRYLLIDFFDAPYIIFDIYTEIAKKFKKESYQGIYICEFIKGSARPYEEICLCGDNVYFVSLKKNIKNDNLIVTYYFKKINNIYNENDEVSEKYKILTNFVVKNNETELANHIIEIKNNKLYLIKMIDNNDYYDYYNNDIFICIICLATNSLLHFHLINFKKLMYINNEKNYIKLTDQCEFNIVGIEPWYLITKDNHLYIKSSMKYYITKPKTLTSKYDIDNRDYRESDWILKFDLINGKLVQNYPISYNVEGIRIRYIDKFTFYDSHKHKFYEFKEYM